MISRRGFLRALGGLAVTGLALGSYAFVIEPGFRLNVTRYAVKPPRWSPGLKLRAVILADPHCVEPQMPLSRWQMIVDAANALQPDLHLLLGDYLASHRFRTGSVAMQDVAKAAAALKAPLGTFGICGNHDWWEDANVQRLKTPLPRAVRIFEDHGIPMLENRAMRLEKSGKAFWLTGTSSILAIRRPRRVRFSRADLGATLGTVTDDAPIIHLAHEPDFFVDVPDRVSLTLSGHTHAGQVRLLGYAPVVASSYGQRFNYGHIVEEDRHLVVSGGLGCSGLPVRFGCVPEIVVVEIG